MRSLCINNDVIVSKLQFSKYKGIKDSNVRANKQDAIVKIGAVSLDWVQNSQKPIWNGSVVYHNVKVLCGWIERIVLEFSKWNFNENMSVKSG